jgi:hypothetical protein
VSRDLRKLKLQVHVSVWRCVEYLNVFKNLHAISHAVGRALIYLPRSRTSAHTSVREREAIGAVSKVYAAITDLDATTFLHDEVAGKPLGDWKNLLIFSLSFGCILTSGNVTTILIIQSCIDPIYLFEMSLIDLDHSTSATSYSIRRKSIRSASSTSPRTSIDYQPFSALFNQ